MRSIIGNVIVDGAHLDPAEAALSVFDIALLRGYGCFEALRSYDRVPFRVEAHLDRLESSAAALGITLAPRSDIDGWIRQKAADVGNGSIRLVVTGGLDQGFPGAGSHTIVFAEHIGDDLPATYRVLPVLAPWHSAGAFYGLTAVKSTSYAPNVSAMLEAATAGFDDALLLGRGDEVLEGPTYSIGWVKDGVAVTPSLELGILASITRGVMIESAAAIEQPLVEVIALLGEMLEADEVFMMSTIREIAPVTAVGDATFAPGRVTASLAKAFHEIVDDETLRL